MSSSKTHFIWENKNDIVELYTSTTYKNYNKTMTHCIHCNKELFKMNAHYREKIDKVVEYGYCTSPTCPLKGLLQVGVENLKEEWNESVEKCSDCGIEWKKIGQPCKVCFAPKEKPKRWKPEMMGKYFFIDFSECNWYIVVDTYEEYPNEKKKIDAGNCFKTREEAELMRDKIKNLLHE